MAASRDSRRPAPSCVRIASPPRVFLAVLLLVASIVACQGRRRGGGLVSPGASIVLISIDTLRADRLGCYGYRRPTSPSIDRVARDSFVFERAYAQSHNTLVSHASLLTSLNPISHGATPRHPLPARITTLAEILQSRGYRRAAFTTHPSWLTRKMGFAQGFGRFRSSDESAEEVNRHVVAWLEAVRRRSSDRPFFLFVHYYDVHSDWHERPYETQASFDARFAAPAVGDFRGCRAGACASVLLSRVADDPSLLSPEELEWVEGLYDGGVAYADHQLGRLLQALQELGFFEESLIVITSDHGEEFLEHGRMLHSQPYEETARVPLVIRPPGGVGQTRLADPVGLVDLAPTLLEAVGVDAPASFEGRSLVPLTESGETSPGSVFWTALGAAPEYAPSRDIAVREEAFTLVTRHGFSDVELYDNETDPDQRRDISDERPDVSRRLREEAAGFYRRQLERSGPTPTATLEPSAEEIEKLRSLGYVGS